MKLEFDGPRVDLFEVKRTKERSISPFELDLAVRLDIPRQAGLRDPPNKKRKSINRDGKAKRK